jgi:hypothetical protein
MGKGKRRMKREIERDEKEGKTHTHIETNFLFLGSKMFIES